MAKKHKSKKQAKNNVKQHEAHKEHHKKEHKKQHQKKTEKNDKLKNIAITILVIALVAVTVWAYSNNAKTPNNENNKAIKTSVNKEIVAAKGDFNINPKIKAEMNKLADNDPSIGAKDAPVTIVEFSDFQCPFCEKFETETLKKIIDKFVNTGVVRFVYRDLPLSFHPHSQKAAEAAECAHEQGKFWEFHDKLFANQKGLSTDNYKKYAAELGLNMEQFNDCLESEKYYEETQEDAKVASEQGIRGTPGFVINGQMINGAQPYDKFEQVICSIVPESEPCKNVEPPTEVKVIIVNDKKCGSECDTTNLKAATKNLFPGAKIEEVDAGTKEGQELIEKYNLVYAPSLLFDSKLEQTKAWKENERLRGAFEKVNDKYKLVDEATGASWFFSEEARAEQEKKINEALGLVKNDNKPQVDFFVMSYCPYGNQAEELLKPVFEKLKGKAKFNPRYVIYTQGTGCYTDEDGTKLCSMHGGVELNEDIRELCVFKMGGEEAWFNFATAMNKKCNYKNADDCWEGVAKEIGLDVEKIKSCFEENKIKYAREQYELNKLLGVRGSPTLFFDGEEYNGARSSNAYLQAICSKFDSEKPEACNENVEETTTSSTSSAASCG